MKKLIGEKTEVVPIYEECCDLCEESMENYDRFEHTATINFSFGYASEKYDGDSGTVVLCNCCAEQLLEQYLWVKKPGHLFMTALNHYSGEQVEKKRLELGYELPLSDSQIEEIRDLLLTSEQKERINNLRQLFIDEG